MKFYAYKGCGSCKKASKWLKEQGVDFEELAIRETPPSLEELRLALKSKGQLKALFNTSGMDYRSMGMKDKLPAMTEADALQLLSENGNLIKRPFAVLPDSVLVGFKPDEWQAAL